MEWYCSALILFGLLILLLAMSVPVGFSLALTGLVGSFFYIGPHAINQLALIVVSSGTNEAFLALPLFIVMSEFIVHSGGATDIYTTCQRWLHRIPGSLALSTVVASALFGAVCGTSTGGAAAMGLVTIPEMLRCNYSKRIATGVVAAGGTLSILIPPSGILIIYALLTKQSIGKLFLAAVIPGILIALLFGIYCVAYAIAKPHDCPNLPSVTWKEKWNSLGRVWAILLVAVFVFTAIYGGIATVTEAAAVGAVTAMVIAYFRHALTRNNVTNIMYECARISCFIFFIVFGALTFGYLLAYINIPSEFVKFLVTIGMTPVTFIISLMVLYAILGCFIDPAGILMITIPIVFPMVVELGLDPLWFGILCTINMELANITPPVGLNLFVIKSVAPPDVKMTDIIFGALPFCVLLAVGLIVLIIFPDIALWLPGQMAI